MLRKRTVLLLFITISIIFLICTSCFLNILTNSQKITSANSLSFAEKITQEYSKLSDEYKVKYLKIDNTSELFINNLNQVENAGDLEQLWRLANSWVSKTQLYSNEDSNLGKVWNALRTAKIVKADLDTRGTQLKFLLTLEGSQEVVFKPKWYEKERIIEGPVYAGKDRYGSEITAFYLSAVLNKPFVPISVERTINLKSEILPFASNRLLSTSFQHKNRTCIYGHCFYCKREDPICGNDKDLLTGAVIFNINKTIKSYRSPWQRTYKKSKQAVWETNEKFCGLLKGKISKHRIYDLVDTAIFDFFIQNGDRHHYETLDDNVILIDNGKGLGNPFIHHIDILAPLYQCCTLRSSTWKRLLELSGGTLQESLTKMPFIEQIVMKKHIEAINERLLYIFAAVEYCRNRNKVYHNLF